MSRSLSFLCLLVCNVSLLAFADDVSREVRFDEEIEVASDVRGYKCTYFNSMSGRTFTNAAADRATARADARSACRYYSSFPDNCVDQGCTSY